MMPTARPSRRAGRPGFSLVELLVVLLIITVIATIVVVGLSTVFGRSETTRTEARLAVLETMVENYRNATRGSTGGGLTGGARPLPGADGFPIEFPLLRADATGAVDDTLLGDTATVMRVLSSIPANKSLAGDQGSDFLSSGTAKDPRNRAITVADIPLDVAGNVVLFVPSQGILVDDDIDPQVYPEPDLTPDAKDGSTIHRPGGAWWQSATTGTFTVTGRTPPEVTNVRVVARDGQPFFFAPGPDGDYATHEDNIYSRPVVGFDLAANTYSE